MKALKVMAGALAATEQFAGRDAAEQVPMMHSQLATSYAAGRGF